MRATIEAIAPDYVAWQRAETVAFNAALPTHLAERGMRVNTADHDSIRARLGDFYARWKREFGPTAWGLLEAAAGPLGPATG